MNTSTININLDEPTNLIINISGEAKVTVNNGSDDGKSNHDSHKKSPIMANVANGSYVIVEEKDTGKKITTIVHPYETDYAYRYHLQKLTDPDGTPLAYVDVNGVSEFGYYRVIQVLDDHPPILAGIRTHYAVRLRNGMVGMFVYRYNVHDGNSNITSMNNSNFDHLVILLLGDGPVKTKTEVWYDIHGKHALFELYDIVAVIPTYN